MNLKYQMGKKYFNAILSTRSEEDKKMNPVEYVKQILNNENKLKGTVTEIFICDE